MGISDYKPPNLLFIYFIKYIMLSNGISYNKHELRNSIECITFVTIQKIYFVEKRLTTIAKNLHLVGIYFEFKSYQVPQSNVKNEPSQNYRSL